MEDADSFLESVQNNEIETINQIISRNKNILKHQYPTSNQTILSKACKDEQVKAETLKILLEKSEKYDIQELFKTVTRRGYHEKVALLIEKKNVEIDTEILCWTIKYSNEEESGMCNFDKCSNIILDKLKSQENYRININAKDKLGHTPLHYSLRYCDNNKSMRLLKLGASLACRNIYGDLPIEYIESDFLKEYLDKLTEKNDKNNSSQKTIEQIYLQVGIDYQTLIPPRIETTKNNDSEDPKITYEAQPETEAIEYMSKAPEFRSLLKHPVIVSFLLTKWHQIRFLFYINFFFYLFFLISLNFFILTYYSKPLLVRSTISIEIHILVLCIFNLTFWGLVLRELFQMIISPELYFRNYDNLAEIILIFVSGIILYIDSSDDTRRILSSIAILLSAYEFMIMGGQNPHFSTYVVMFQTVTKNFFKLLLLYSLLIIAFALTFHIVFATVDKKNQTNKPNETLITQNITEQNLKNQTAITEDSEKSMDVFKNPYESIFKTIFMLTGEFNSDSLNFKSYPVTSRIIICLFVFMISITLLNLLNGLAVSDTQQIQNDAKFVGYVALVQQICYVESMFFGKLSPWLEKKFFKFLASIVKKSCIFKSSQAYLYIYPNLKAEVLTDEKNEQNIETINKIPWYRLHWYYFNHVCLDKESYQKLLSIIKSNAKNK